MKIPSDRFGSGGPLLHFAHANGYPPGSYRKLFSYLDDYSIEAAHLRPIWGFEEGDANYGIASAPNWLTYAQDLDKFHRENDSGKLIGMGHSLGAVATLFDAEKNPERYRGLILIDPVILPKHIYPIFKIVPFSLRKYIVPPAKIARVRNDTWPTAQHTFDHFRPKRVFSKISDEVLWDFLECGLVPGGKGVQLRYSKNWEVHVYVSHLSPWKAFKNSTVPTLVVRGTQTDVIPDPSWELLQQTRPDGAFEEVEDAGHLLPFESPEKLAGKIRQFCENLG